MTADVHKHSSERSLCHGCNGVILPKHDSILYDHHMASPPGNIQNLPEKADAAKAQHGRKHLKSELP